MLSKIVVITLTKKGRSYLPPHAITEDIIRCNIAQMTSTSKHETGVKAMMVVAKDNLENSLN